MRITADIIIYFVAALALMAPVAALGANACSVSAFQKALESTEGEVAVQRGSRQDVMIYQMEHGELKEGPGTVEAAVTEGKFSAKDAKVTQSANHVKVSAAGKMYDVTPPSESSIGSTAYHLKAGPSEVSFTGGGGLDGAARNQLVSKLEQIPTGQKITIKTSVQVEVKARELASPKIRELEQYKSNIRNYDPKDIEAKAKQIWSEARATAQKIVQPYESTFAGVSKNGKVLTTQVVRDSTGQIVGTRSVALDLNVIESFKCQTSHVLTTPVAGQ
jgi:hypothetical protein